MRAAAVTVMVRYGTGMEDSCCWVMGSEAKLQAGRTTAQSAQSGMMAALGVERSHGRKGSE
eukprot:1180925-Pleurochrysis_carterae.AAC.2